MPSLSEIAAMPGGAPLSWRMGQRMEELTGRIHQFGSAILPSALARPLGELHRCSPSHHLPLSPNPSREPLPPPLHRPSLSWGRTSRLPCLPKCIYHPHTHLRTAPRSRTALRARIGGAGADVGRDDVETKRAVEVALQALRASVMDDESSPYARGCSEQQGAVGGAEGGMKGKSDGGEGAGGQVRGGVEGGGGDEGAGNGVDKAAAGAEGGGGGGGARKGFVGIPSLLTSLEAVLDKRHKLLKPQAAANAKQALDDLHNLVAHSSAARRALSSCGEMRRMPHRLCCPGASLLSLPLSIPDLPRTCGVWMHWRMRVWGV
jgi:hypothetical protein